MLIDKKYDNKEKHSHTRKQAGGGDLKYTFILNKGKQKVNKVMNNAYKVKKKILK